MDARDDYIARSRIETQDNWRGWIGQIPFVQFSPEWKVQVIPPFAGAVARFRVLLPSGGTKSIYLDCYDRLGYYGKPYWEVHPYRGDVGRCDMADTTELLAMIADEAEE